MSCNFCSAPLKFITKDVTLSPQGGYILFNSIVQCIIKGFVVFGVFIYTYVSYRMVKFKWAVLSS